MGGSRRHGHGPSTEHLMFRCFLYSQLRVLALLLWMPRALFEHGWSVAFKRLFIFVLGIPLFWGLQTLHWFGMLLDAFLFPSWKNTKVNSPLFIVGIPRSGTTFMQRTLVHDRRFTSTQLWEVLLAPSISEKIFWTSVEKFFRPLRRSFGRQKFFSRMKSIHTLKLDKPEEDFLFLLPLNACFILIVFFPSAQGLWRLSRFDETLFKRERKLIMHYYRSCVQKHLYFHNLKASDDSEKIYMAKNPSFTSMIDSLQETFDDAKFIVCVREPAKTVASQISSLKPAFGLLGNGRLPQGFVENCIDMLYHYYERLGQGLITEENTFLLLNTEIRSNLQTRIKQMYECWDWTIDDKFAQFLQTKSERSRGHSSRHKYSLADFGLDRASIEARFDPVWPISAEGAEVITHRQEPQTTSHCIAIVSDAAPHRNGVGAYYEDLVRHLAERVEGMHIVSPTITTDGKWQGGLPLPMPGDSTQKCILPNPFELYRKLKALRPDVIILPTPGPYGFAGLLFAKLSGAKIVVVFHTWYEKLSELYWNRWQSWFNKTYLTQFNKLLFHYAQLVLVNSDSMGQIVSKISNRTSELVGTPVTYDFIHTPIKLPSGALEKVLFVGRLAAEKNLEAIIEAARALPDMQFDIAGDGPQRELVEQASNSLHNLHYIGWVDRNALLELIDDHDLLALPSHVESFGTVALEAMTRQRIALVSTHCGISEWADLKKGLQIIAKDETLATALERLSRESKASRIAMAEKARQCAVAQSNWNLDRWLKLLAEVAQKD